MNKKNVMYGLLALLGLYFVTKKSGSSTDTPTEDKGTPDLGNGSTPTVNVDRVPEVRETPVIPQDLKYVKQASTPPVVVRQASTPPVVVRQASTPPVVVRQASTPMPPMPRVQGRSNMPNEMRSSGSQVMYASTSPSLGEPKNVYSM